MSKTSYILEVGICSDATNGGSLMKKALIASLLFILVACNIQPIAAMAEPQLEQTDKLVKSFMGRLKLYKDVISGRRKGDRKKIAQAAAWDAGKLVVALGAAYFIGNYRSQKEQKAPQLSPEISEYISKMGKKISPFFEAYESENKSLDLVFINNKDEANSDSYDRIFLHPSVTKLSKITVYPAGHSDDTPKKPIVVFKIVDRGNQKKIKIIKLMNKPASSWFAEDDLGKEFSLNQ